MIDILRIKYKRIIPLLSLSLLLYIMGIIVIVAHCLHSPNTIFLLTQLIFIPITTFIILYLFNDLFGTKNSLFLHTYYKKNIFKIYTLSLFIFMIPLSFICFSIATQYKDFNGIAAFFLLFTELFLFSSLSLLLFVFVGDISVIITVFVLYISNEIASFGSFDYIYHIFFMNLQDNINFSTTINSIVLNLILGILSYRILKLFIS